MTFDYIFDGEIHPINHNFAYILERVEADRIESEIVQNKKNEYIYKFIKYKFKFDNEFNIYFERYQCGDIDYEDIIKLIWDNCAFIFKPPWVTSYLSQYGTTALKFKRNIGDDLCLNLD